jgi:hypothetical protein
MRIVTYLIEYLGKFKFIFETILQYESGDQMGPFDAKIRHRKSHAWAPLNGSTNAIFTYMCGTVAIHHKSIPEAHFTLQRYISYEQGTPCGVCTNSQVYFFSVFTSF